MATLEVERPYLSVSRILRAANPKEELVSELIGVIGVHLKALGMPWDPKAFRAGLQNPELPTELLGKLEDFLHVAESLSGPLPRAVGEALGRVLEDIEAFNPAFLASMTASRSSGRVGSTVVKKRLGV